jgi:hypothetical protein
LDLHALIGVRWIRLADRRRRRDKNLPRRLGQRRQGPYEGKNQANTVVPTQTKFVTFSSEYVTKEDTPLSVLVRLAWGI